MAADSEMLTEMWHGPNSCSARSCGTASPSRATSATLKIGSNPVTSHPPVMSCN